MFHLPNDVGPIELKLTELLNKQICQYHVIVEKMLTTCWK
jgi:hypothetical protein